MSGYWVNFGWERRTSLQPFHTDLNGSIDQYTRRREPFVHTYLIRRIEHNAPNLPNAIFLSNLDPRSSLTSETEMEQMNSHATKKNV